MYGNAENKFPKQRGRPFKPGTSGNPRGRPKGSRNKRTRALLESAQTGGELPLDYMLRVMRDPNAPVKRRDEMAKSAAPYLHSKLLPAAQSSEPDSSRTTGIEISFVVPEPAVSLAVGVMSALPPKADSCSATAYVRFGSEADICAAISRVRFTPNSDHESGHWSWVSGLNSREIRDFSRRQFAFNNL